MSSRSTSKSAATVLDSADATSTEDAAMLQGDPTEPETLTMEPEVLAASNEPGSESSATETESEWTPAAGENISADTSPEDTADLLARQLEQLVSSVAVVEDLSRRARDVATTDLALYDALIASQQQYAARVRQASTIRDQAHSVHEHAFGHEARSAAEPLVANAERVVQAFTDLSDAWRERACVFADEHPDIQFLLAEREAQAEQTRQAEAQAARGRRLHALLMASDEAIKQGVLHEGRRLLEVLEHEFPGQTPAADQLRLRLEQQERADKDNTARQALAACAEHQARGDFEGSVNILEQVDVHGLSVEVSQDVFGRWSDACSRLAQTAGATLLRFASAQGRGLILYSDSAYPNGLIVFSSLGMGPGYPQGKVVTDVVILRRARPFREAAPLPTTSWAGVTAAPATVPAAAPVRH